MEDLDSKNNTLLSFTIFTKKRIAIFTAIIVVIFAVFIYSILPPRSFSSGTVVKISRGTNLAGVAVILKKENIIKSSFLFSAVSIFLGGEHTVIAGDYLFKTPLTVFLAAKRLVAGDFGLPMAKVTIPEGVTVKQIGLLVLAKVQQFDSVAFDTLASTSEGYFFPDTYFFSPHVTPQEVFMQMKESFAVHTSSLTSDVSKSGRTFADIITMASILEGEAKTDEDRKIVAGILWRRIDLNMPLQVDAPFMYILGKTSAELTAKDLKINSPYNTYVHAGLPPAPISNPGLDSIHAALNPTKTDYLFYLSDKNQTMHYAKDFKAHIKNEQKYLR